MDGILSYFSGLDPSALLNTLPGALAQGIIWGIMALGVYITFKLLDVADLSVDGTFATGGAVTVMLRLADYPIWFCMLIAVAAGLAAGAITGILHTMLGIPAILAGILTQLALYSVNLHIMGGANKPFGFRDDENFFVSSGFMTQAIIVSIIFAVALICLLYWYFGTEHGSALRATGSNHAMSRAQGININTMKIVGLVLSNGIVALSGSLYTQYQGNADINMGRGAIVIGLAAVIIGEVVGMAIFGKKMTFWLNMIFIVIGGILYYMVINFAIWLNINTEDLKLISAVIVALFLAVPYLKAQKKSSFRQAKKKGEKLNAEGK